MFTYNNIMRALKTEGGIPDYWYSQINSVSTNTKALGVVVKHTTASSSSDVYPIYINDHNDANEASGSAAHHWPLNSNANDVVGTGHGSYAQNNFSGGGVTLVDADRVYLNGNTITNILSTLKRIRCVFKINASTTAILVGLVTLSGNKIKLSLERRIDNRYSIVVDVLNSTDTLFTCVMNVNSVIEKNVVHVVDITINGGDLVTYLNGVKIGEMSWDGTYTSSTSPTYDAFGNAQTGAGTSSMTIYDVKVYTVLPSAQDIANSAKGISRYGIYAGNYKLWMDSVTGKVYFALQKSNYLSDTWSDFNGSYSGPNGSLVADGTGLTLGSGYVTSDQTAVKNCLYYQNPNNTHHFNTSVTTVVQFSTTEMTRATYRYIAYHGSGWGGDSFGICLRIIPNTNRIVAAVYTTNGNPDYDLRYQNSPNYYEYNSGEIITATATFNPNDKSCSFWVGTTLISKFYPTDPKLTYYIKEKTISIFNIYSGSFDKTKGFNGTCYDVKFFENTFTQRDVDEVVGGQLIIEDAHTNLIGGYSPSVYLNTDAIIDSTSIIADHPDANDWQPYGTYDWQPYGT